MTLRECASGIADDGEDEAVAENGKLGIGGEIVGMNDESVGQCEGVGWTWRDLKPVCVRCVLVSRSSGVV